MSNEADALIKELRVDTQELGDVPIIRSHALPAEALTALLADPEEPPWRAVEEGRVRFRVSREAERIRLKGDGEALLTHACVRCLREVRFPVTFELDVIFEKGAVPKPGDEEVVGAGVPHWEDESADLLAQADVVPYDGKYLDVATIVREQLFLEAPMHPACDLAGAQPEPGECNLDPDGALAAEHDRWQDPRWDALRAMRDTLPPGDS